MRRVGAMAWLLVLLLSGSASAHRLSVFAYVEGADIVGEVYFAGGGKAAGVVVQLRDPADHALQTTASESDGGFVFAEPGVGDYRVVADSGDGHRAEWRVTAGEFGDSPVVAPALATVSESAGRSNAASVLPGDATVERLDRQMLVDLVEQAVARQVGPLRAELHAYREAARFSDVVGGVGIIFGLAGIGLWWRHRKSAGRP